MTTKPQSTTEETPVNVHALTVFVCQDCIDLKGVMCNNAECVFCRRTMVEVQRYLDVMLLCPIVDGRRLILVGDAVTNEALAAIPAAATAAPVEQCAKCGHLNELNENGICQHVKIAASNTDGPTLICGCDCLTASACLRCGHSTIDHHGECRQCIDWQRHKCTFAETTQRCQHCSH